MLTTQILNTSFIQEVQGPLRAPIHCHSQVQSCLKNKNKNKQQKQKPLKQTERESTGGRERSWFWTKLFYKITPKAWSSIEKRLLFFFFFFSAKRLGPVSRQVFQTSVKTTKQTESAFCVHIVNLSFMWGFRCERWKKPHCSLPEGRVQMSELAWALYHCRMKRKWSA